MYIDHMDDIYDAYDDYISELYHEHIKEFKEELVASYFTGNPYLAKPAFDALTNAQYFNALIAEKPNEPFFTAGFIFSAVAIELCMKDLIFRPFVHGIVHADFAANLIVKLVMNDNNKNTQKGLHEIISEMGEVDLKSYKRPGSVKTIYEEIREVRSKRNSVLHAGEKVSLEDFNLSIAVASTMIQEIFPKIVHKIRFHLHDDYKVCNSLSEKCKAIIT